MIFTLELFRTVPNGKKVRGYMNFRQSVTSALRNKEKEVGVLLCDMSAGLDKGSFLEQCGLAFEEYIRIKEAEELLEKLKSEMEL